MANEVMKNPCLDALDTPWHRENAFAMVCGVNIIWWRNRLIVHRGVNCVLNRDTNCALLTSQDTGKVRTFVKTEGRLTKCTVCAPSCQCYFYPGLLEHVKNSSF